MVTLVSCHRVSFVEKKERYCIGLAGSHNYIIVVSWILIFLYEGKKCGLFFPFQDVMPVVIIMKCM